MRVRKVWPVVATMVAVAAGFVRAAETNWPADPLFDWPAIMTEPLDARVLKTTESDGIVIEEFDYASQVVSGAVERIFGILAYPRGGTNLPAVFWSQSGMYQANEYFPKVFARKGYFCLNITLPTGRRNAFAPFDVRNPKEANLTRLAVDQLRAITYMTQRPEVDRERMGIGGSSYGGFFATLMAGADPRIKAGFSYFGAGRQDMGTHLPQFVGLPDRSAAEVWARTIDPAWRLKARAVPFMWCASGNDNWFHLPSVVATFEESAGDKRLAIIPGWQHGFPENVDRQLADWLDTCLTHTRPPYNRPGKLEFEVRNGALAGRWDWTGGNAVTSAALVVCYGPAQPWHGWVQRYHHPIAAAISGSTAEATIPVPDPDMELYAYGNITDERGVVMSTVPKAIRPSALRAKKTRKAPAINCFAVGDFEPADIALLERMGDGHMLADPDERHTGAQSLRLEGGKPYARWLWHVPGQSHRLSVWLKASSPTNVTVAVSGTPPQNGDRPLVDALRRTFEETAQTATNAPVRFRVDAPVGPDWKEFVVECPYDGQAEGYSLQIAPPRKTPATVWIDTVRFEPGW